MADLPGRNVRGRVDPRRTPRRNARRHRSAGVRSASCAAAFPSARRRVHARPRCSSIARRPRTGQCQPVLGWCEQVPASRKLSPCVATGVDRDRQEDLVATASSGLLGSSRCDECRGVERAGLLAQRHHVGDGRPCRRSHGVVQSGRPTR